MADSSPTFMRLDPSGIGDAPLERTAFIKPEWIDQGRADEKGHFFYSNDERNVQVGYWECTPFRETIDFPYDELGIVIAGRLELIDSNARSQQFGPGDMFFIPRGAKTTWHIMEPFKQYYMIYAPRDAQYYRF